MKKLLLTISLITSIALSAQAFTGTLGVQNVFYNPQTKTWSDQQQTKDDIHIKNKRFIGSGGFSEYYYENGKVAIGPVTNVEFVDNGRLIGVNSHDLKFFQFFYNDDKITSQTLSEEEVQKLYPDYEIVKISQFTNNKITIYKKFFQKKNILLLNDTPLSFYKYTYKPTSVNPSYIKTFITLSHPGKIVFSHYGDDTPEMPALTIYVKNKF